MSIRAIAEVELHIPPGKAKPGPLIRTALGQFGINPGDFCTVFNSETEKMTDDLVKVLVSCYRDSSFSLEMLERCT